MRHESFFYKLGIYSSLYHKLFSLTNTFWPIRSSHVFAEVNNFLESISSSLDDKVSLAERVRTRFSRLCRMGFNNRAISGSSLVPYNTREWSPRTDGSSDLLSDSSVHPSVSWKRHLPAGFSPQKWTLMKGHFLKSRALSSLRSCITLLVVPKKIN